MRDFTLNNGLGNEINYLPQIFNVLEISILRIYNSSFLLSDVYKWQIFFLISNN